MRECRRVLPLLLALLLVLSLSALANAEADGAPAFPPVQRYGGEAANGSEIPPCPTPELSEQARHWLEQTAGEVRASTEMTVEEMVQAVVAECRAAGVTGEYETALWLHDWLIYHADYDSEAARTNDTSSPSFGPEGVLLNGMGVCQSYCGAYELLLAEVGIESMRVESPEMSHTWNLVKIDGVWCHVDVTYDDPTSPGAVGGNENRNYFGMSDALMRRDHFWQEQGLPAAGSLQNYYPLRSGDICYSTQEELEAQLDQKAAAQINPIKILYVGTDPEHQSLDAFRRWYAKNDWRFGLYGWSGPYMQYSCTVTISYGEPWEQPPANHLETPVQAPDFTLSGPEGLFPLERYSGNGLLLVFGQTTCPNTLSLLSRLYPSLPTLHENGIEVLASFEGCCQTADLDAVKTQFPDFRLCYDGVSLLWDLVELTYGESGSVGYPCVFILNGAGQIVYYHLGPVLDLEELTDELLATANGLPVPEPEPRDYSAGTVTGASLDALNEGEVKRALQAACSAGKRVFFVTDHTFSYSMYIALEEWEADHELFEELGFTLVARVESLDAETAADYPHVSFVPVDSADPFFWEMLRAVGYSDTTAYYFCGYYLEPDGSITYYCNGGSLNLWDRLTALLLTMRFDLCAPDALESVEAGAFESDGFVSLDLSTAPVTSIGARAFADNAALRFVRVPDSVAQLAPDAFDGCGKLILICSYNSAAAQLARANGIRYICP